MRILEQVKDFVTESFGKEYIHLERTMYWIKELDPGAGEELLIAARSHDIERAFSLEAKDMKEYRTGFAQELHETEGGRIMFEFLVGRGYDSIKANRVRELISRHETGGDAESDLLKDADSLSWLEMSAPKHIGKRMFPKAELEKKVAFMFERISSERAKALARPFYEAALKLLDEME